MRKFALILSAVPMFTMTPAFANSGVDGTIYENHGGYHVNHYRVHDVYRVHHVSRRGGYGYYRGDAGAGIALGILGGVLGALGR